MAPSSRNNNKKKTNSSKKKKNAAAVSDYEGAVAAAIRDIDLHWDREEIDAHYGRVAGLRGLPPDRTAADEQQEPPDVPPCDYCGENWTGHNTCVNCQSVFYCSKECQRSSWRVGGHRRECDQLRERCQVVSQEIVAAMTADPSLLDDPTDRVCQFDRLANAGYYKAALEHGINPAIQQLFQEDRDAVLQRFRDERDSSCCSYTNWITCVLFRGGRREGHEMGKGTFSHVDGFRCKSYLASHPRAFEDWFEASMVVLTLFLHPAFRRNDPLRISAQRAARDVISAWSMVLTNHKVAKAIVLPPPPPPSPPAAAAAGEGSEGGNDGSRSSATADAASAAAGQRATWVAKQLRSALTKLHNAPEGLDAGSSLEGILNQVAAMYYLRMQQHGVVVAVDVDDQQQDDFVKLLGLAEGVHGAMFTGMAVPLAGATIRKGRALTNDEARAALSSFSG